MTHNWWRLICVPLSCPWLFCKIHFSFRTVKASLLKFEVIANTVCNCKAIDDAVDYLTVILHKHPKVCVCSFQRLVPEMIFKRISLVLFCWSLKASQKYIHKLWLQVYKIMCIKNLKGIFEKDYSYCVKMVLCMVFPHMLCLCYFYN